MLLVPIRNCCSTDKFVTHKDVNLAFSDELYVLRYVTVLHYSGACCITLNLNVTDELVDDFIGHITQAINVAEHHASELHQVVLIITYFCPKTLMDVRERNF